MSQPLTTACVFEAIVEAVSAEDRALRKLLSGRAGYERYVPGIATTFETGTVYAIFKTLVRTLPEPWIVDWESPHGVGSKKIDLVLRRRGPGRPACWALEVKWWTKGGASVADDCEKLRSAKGATRAFLLVLGAGAWPLGRLLDRAFAIGRLQEHVSVVHQEELDVLGRGQEWAKLGIAMLEVHRGR